LHSSKIATTFAICKNIKMKYAELKRKLIKAGCQFVKQKSNHEWWFSPIKNQHFPIQRHGNMDIGINLIKQIEKESGVKLS